jgi:hypothetical protein
MMMHHETSLSDISKPAFLNVDGGELRGESGDIDHAIGERPRQLLVVEDAEERRSGARLCKGAHRSACLGFDD